MSKTTPPITKQVLANLPVESLYPNAKKSLANAPSKPVDLNVQKLIDDYIKKAGRDPKAINEMIEAKRNATKQVISKARDYYIDMSATLVQYNTLYDKSSNKKDREKQEVIAKISANITQIQKNIYTTEQNVLNNISHQFDKKFDLAQKNEKLMKLEKAKEVLNKGLHKIEQIARPEVSSPSPKELNVQLKQTEQALKTWQELSKARDDTDRSKGFAKFSDNLASMTTTSVNAPRKALALGQALLTYAVVDVVYTGLVKGTAKGLVKGAHTGYTAANNAVKRTANNLYKMVDNSQKNLDKEVKKLMEEHVIKLVDQSKNLPAEHELLTPYVKSVESKKTNTYTPVTKDYLEAAKSPQEKAKLLIACLEYNDINVESLKAAYDSAVAASKPSLPTRFVAGTAGIVPAIVTGVVNAVWEGIKKPTLAATVDMPKGVGNRLTNLKKEKEWARTHSEVKQHREAKKIAEAIGAYAKKAQPEEFNTMVKEKKAQERAAKKRQNNSNGIY